MAAKKPLVLNSGLPAQIQSGDSIDAAATELITSPAPPVTDNAIARWGGTDGHLLQNSTIIVSDAGVISGPTGITHNDGSSFIHGATGGADNAVLRSDGAGGTVLQGSSVVITDAGAVSGVASITHTDTSSFIHGSTGGTSRAVLVADGTGGTKAIAAENVRVDSDGRILQNVFGSVNLAYGASDTLQNRTTGVSNFAIGSGALRDLQDGSDNNAFGIGCFQSLVSGAQNVGLGQSVFQNATGNDNVGMGHAAGLGVTSGSQNTCVGKDSGRSITTGSGNTFLGHNAGENASQLVSASNSTGLGQGAFTTKSNQVVIGDTNVEENVFHGNMVFNSQSDPFVVVAVNDAAGDTVFVIRTYVDAASQFAIGNNAGQSITTGVGNTMVGNSAGANITSGNNNMCLGGSTGVGITEGGGNMCIGSSSLASVTTQSFNVGIGTSSGQNSTGTLGTFLGHQAGLQLTTGNFNTCVGSRAGRSASQVASVSTCTMIGSNAFTTGSGAIAIGFQAEAKANQAVIGSSTITETVLRGDVEVRNGTTAQELHVYETYTSDSNFERFRVSFSGGVCTLETSDDGTNGTASALALGTNGVKRTEIGADGVVASGSVFQPGHFIAGYSSGTAYTLTATYAEVTGGTSNSAIVLDQPGTYKITCHMITRYVGTNFGAGETIDIKLRRTNNTAADLANSEVFMNTYEDPSVTAGFEAQPKMVFYTTANSNDRIALFARLSALPGAGSVEIHSDHIIAERVA